jgi:hypothetical protein
MKGERADVAPGRIGVSRRAGTLAAAATLALAATVFVVNSCGDDDSSEDDASTTTGPSETTSTTLSAEDEVEDAYLAFAEMGARLLQAPDPTDPEIAERSTGQAQSDLVDGLTTLRSMDQHYELGPDYGHDVLNIDVEGDQAVLDVCVVDDSWLLDSTGNTVAQGTTSVRWDVQAVRADDVWRVATITEQDVQQGVTECA